MTVCLSQKYVQRYGARPFIYQHYPFRKHPLEGDWCYETCFFLISMSLEKGCYPVSSSGEINSQEGRHIGRDDHCNSANRASRLSGVEHCRETCLAKSQMSACLERVDGLAVVADNAYGSSRCIFNDMLILCWRVSANMILCLRLSRCSNS